MKQTAAEPADPFREQAVQATALVVEVLDHRIRGRFAAAQLALGNLRELGIDLRFTSPVRGTQAKEDAHGL